MTALFTFFSASRIKNSGSTASASAVLPGVVGVFLCLAKQ